MNEQVSFTRLDQATTDDFTIMHKYMSAEHSGLADRVLGLLKNLSGQSPGLKVDRLEHSLQTATRAQADGRMKK